MFRLPEHKAVINRLGFNNDGVDALVRNVEKARRNGILGINIGKNKDTPNEKAAEDYIYCLERVFALADYVTVNISSPNTTGLRDLQEEETLRRFIGELREAQEELGGVHGHRTPMLLKVSPDLSDEELDGMASVLNVARIDGVIVSNTTVDRSEVAGHPLAGEAGGLSGQPLYARVHRRAAQAAPAPGRLDPDHRRGRHPQRRGRGRQDRRRRASWCSSTPAWSIRGPDLIGECVGSIRRLREGSGVSGGYQLAEDVSLAGRNTFRVPARAAMMADVTRAEALAELFDFAMLRDGPVMVLGEGSNLLFAGDFPGVVVCLTMASARILEDDGGQRAGARRGRRDLERPRHLDPGQGPVRAGEHGADPRHGRRQPDPEHRRLRRGSRRVHRDGRGLPSRHRPGQARVARGLRLRLPRQRVQGRTRSLGDHRRRIPPAARARTAARLRRRARGAGGDGRGNAARVARGRGDQPDPHAQAAQSGAARQRRQLLQEPDAAGRPGRRHCKAMHPALPVFGADERTAPSCRPPG